MKIVDQSKLNLSDVLDDYLSDVPPDKRQIAVHQFLTHTSGLPDRFSADEMGEQVTLSLLAGYVTAAVARENPMPLVWVLAGIHLVLGIIAETSYWSLMPVWYHLVFLALVLPATVCGGMLRVRRKGGASAW